MKPQTNKQTTTATTTTTKKSKSQQEGPFEHKFEKIKDKGGTKVLHTLYILLICFWQ